MNKYELTQKITRAILMGQDTYVFSQGDAPDLTCKLPSPQRAGTYTQQETYARMQASAIVELFQEKVNGSDNPTTTSNRYDIR
jgi:hypothetical protein